MSQPTGAGEALDPTVDTVSAEAQAEHAEKVKFLSAAIDYHEREAATLQERADKQEAKAEQIKAEAAEVDARVAAAHQAVADEKAKADEARAELAALEGAGA